MNIGRREFLQLAGIVTALSSTIRQASAQAYPTQPIRLIAPFPAGQAADNIARLMAQALSDRLGQQVIVENRPGASGNIGTELVTKAEPDGYTLLMEVVTSIVINTSLYPHPNFDFIRYIAPVANIGAGVYVLVVNPEVPAKTLPESITYAKANPGVINMVSAGIGTPPHAFGALFMTMTGIDMVHVPYSASYMADLIGGRVQVMFSPMPTTIQQFLRRPVARAGSDDEDPLRAYAGPADDRRIRAWLRGRRSIRDRSAKPHPKGYHRETKQGDQRQPRRSCCASPACRPWR